jgi:hypothetical protein
MLICYVEYGLFRQIKRGDLLMRLAFRRRLAPAAVILATVALPLAAAGTAQASAARFRPGPPADYNVSATMTLEVTAGSTVSIAGGGPGAVCTTDETNTTLTATAAPVTVPFGFTARTSGACAFETSSSDFVVTVRDARGMVTATRTIRLAGSTPASYQVHCTVPGTQVLNLNCRQISDREVGLYQTGDQTGPGGGGGGGTKGYDEYATMRLYVGGPGPDIHVEGGGGGTSNCTSRETNAKVTAGPDPTPIRFGFYAKDDGSCGTEPSWSYFHVTISGQNSSGKEVNGTAWVRFGQEDRAGQPYVVSCEKSSVNVSCRRDDLQQLTLTLTAPR